MTSISETFQEIILPVVVTFIVYDVVGFLGNVVVLFIYSCRYEKNRFRCLVLWLSIIDFTSCCSTVPMETVSTWLWFSAPSRILCKAKNFCVQFTGQSAIYMLFVTAVYKYRQICHPFKKQATQRVIIMSCTGGAILSFLLAIPAAYLWDINHYNFTSENFTEHVSICEVQFKYHDTIYPALYRHCLSAYSVFLLATVILYIFVAKATIRHFRRLKRRSILATHDNPVFSIDLTKNDNEHEGHETVKDEVGNNGHTSKYSAPIYHNIDNSSTVKKTQHLNQNARSQLTPSRIRKVAIMVVIAGSFSISFFMALGFGYVFAVRDYGDFSSINDLVVLFCCYRFYFINYSLNPLVYLALDGKFRKEVLRLFTCGRFD